MKKTSHHFILMLVIFLMSCSSNQKVEDGLARDTQYLVKHNPTDRGYTTYFHENYYDQLAIDNIMLFFTRENEEEPPKALGMILNYTKKDPLNIQHYKFSFDGKEVIYQPENLYTIDDPEKEKTIISCQDTLDSQSFEMVKNLINSEQARIIYIGENDSVSHAIDAKAKKQLLQVIEAYESMGGKLP